MREALRSPQTVLENLAEKAKDSSYRFERLYRNLYNPEFYWLAYQRIYAAPGNMTPGNDGKTIDGMGEERIQSIIAKLKSHAYQPTPARRVYIPKKNSAKMRPLGIPSSEDKLVQEVVRMLLESIYESSFSPKSHGFRPERSCHTALLQIQQTFTGISWFVEGDIHACFDSFDHHVLINILRRRIADEQFIELMWKFLRAGYMEQWEYHCTYSGTPQGSGMSPILANIYLNELDSYIEEYAKRFNCGEHDRRTNPEYSYYSRNLTKIRKSYSASWNSMTKAERQTAIKLCRSISSQMRKTSYHLRADTSYKRLLYCRYADDFIIGVIGSKDDAERIKADVKAFLGESLKLEMSETKTKITHASEAARFLSYDITRNYSGKNKRCKDGSTRRVCTANIKLMVPHEKWFDKLIELKAMRIEQSSNGKETWMPIHRGELNNLEDIRIINKYNAEIRGLYNYYSLANNATVISKFAHIMEYSMYKTFARKYRITMSQAIRKYSKDGKFRVPYQTKAGIKYCFFYDGGFKRKHAPVRNLGDVLPKYRKYDSPNTLAGRLRCGVCELCGTHADKLVMHHIRKMADLKGNSDWETLMKKKRRKTLAVCEDCHRRIHSQTQMINGKPDTSKGVSPV